MIRRAVAADLEALLRLEQACFATDRLSRRSLRTLLSAPSAILLVAEDDAAAPAGLRGYVLLLFRAGTALARLYSIAVTPEATGQGLGRRLMEEAQAAAISAGKIVIRLEVAVGNLAARRLYDRLGYRIVRRLPGYYEDGEDALRMEKPLRQRLEAQRRIPYYPQSTEFTCGPACLMMMLAHHGLIQSFDPVLEVRLWREATTIFMGSGLGGCEPLGMAVAIAERGLRPALHLSDSAPFLLQTVGHPEKRRVMALAQHDFAERARAMGLSPGPALDARALAKRIDDGAVAIVLISGNRMYRLRQPHWVVVHARVAGYLLVHDPWILDDGFESVTDAMNLPIPIDEFDRMSRFGTRPLRAALVFDEPAVGVASGRAGAGAPFRNPALE